ncbi:MAG: hypothetical protein JNL08_18210 [Planctomycetes bacterium]|nr:hypothetical protein [Planctomycetota bacterium]
MSLALDLLPAAYRQRVATRRANRELAWMAIPVVAALVGTDLLLRQRVANVTHMAELAREQAFGKQHLAATTREMTRRAGELQQAIETAAAQIAAPRMTALLDGLLADRPAGVRFQELLCVLDPWTPSGAPTVQLRASCATAAEFTQYVTALRVLDALPPLACERSDILPGSGDFGFQLQTDTAAAAAAAAAAPGGGR